MKNFAERRESEHILYMYMNIKKLTNRSRKNIQRIKDKTKDHKQKE